MHIYTRMYMHIHMHIHAYTYSYKYTHKHPHTKCGRRGCMVRLGEGTIYMYAVIE